MNTTSFTDSELARVETDWAACRSEARGLLGILHATEMETEVQGHYALPLNPGEEELLRRFANGQLTDKKERQCVLLLLRQNSLAMEMFAALLQDSTAMAA